MDTKIGEVDNKYANHDDEYVTCPEFKKLTAENFTARLKQTNLVINSDFDDKLTSFNKKLTLNKTKYLEIQNK